MGDVYWLAELRAEVKRRLKARHTTQKALAEYLGITEKHLCQMLAGRIDGGHEVLERLALAMGLKIAVVSNGPVLVPVTESKRGRNLKKLVSDADEEVQLTHGRVAAGRGAIASRNQPGRCPGVQAVGGGKAGDATGN